MPQSEALHTPIPKHACSDYILSNHYGKGNTFATAEVRDLSGPVIRLQNLAPEELYVLLSNIRNIFASGDEDAFLVPDEALKSFMEHCSKQVGSAYFQTPRKSIKAFVDLLSLLEQHPSVKWTDKISEIKVEDDLGASAEQLSGESGGGDFENDDLASFTL